MAARNFFLQFAGAQLILRVKVGDDTTDLDAVEEPNGSVSAGDFAVCFDRKGVPCLFENGEKIAVGRTLDNGSLHWATETGKERMGALIARMRHPLPPAPTPPSA